MSCTLALNAHRAEGQAQRHSVGKKWLKGRSKKAGKEKKGRPEKLEAGKKTSSACGAAVWIVVTGLDTSQDQRGSLEFFEFLFYIY